MRLNLTARGLCPSINQLNKKAKPELAIAILGGRMRARTHKASAKKRFKDNEGPAVPSPPDRQGRALAAFSALDLPAVCPGRRILEDLRVV